MEHQLSNKLIRSKAGNRLALAEYFSNILPSVGWRAISDHLIESVRLGALPPNVFGQWLDVCHESDAVVAAMTQTASAHGRRKGIKAFGAWLRRKDGFHSIWNSVGGVEGMLRLMADMCVNDVEYLCKMIQNSSGSLTVLESRQEAISTLFGALTGTIESIPNPDKRPLGEAYQKMIPACAPDVASKAIDAPHRLRKSVLHARPALFEAAALAAMFPQEGQGRTVRSYDHLIGHSWRFAFAILQRLAKDKLALERNKDMVIDPVATFLSRRLYHVRGDSGMREQVLRLVVDCVRQHPPIARFLVGGRGRSLIFYAVRLWGRSKNPEARSQIEQHLVSLLAALPSHVYEVDVEWLKAVVPELRFRLLRLILLHVQCFQLDIEVRSTENDEKLARIKSWNPSIFMVLPEKQGLELLERLASLHPDDTFLNGDLEETMKHFKEPVRNEEYYAEKRKSLKDLMEKAASQREPSDRGYQATRALLFTVEMQSLALFHETILWARRFIRDPRFPLHFYDAGVFCKQDTIDMLSGIALPPTVNSKKWQKPLTPVAFGQSCENIPEANKIMLLLYETASMSLREPSFNQWHWRDVLSLPAKIVRTRMERAHELQERSTITDSQLFEIIWTPTIEFLLEIERFSFEHGGADALDTNSICGPIGSLGLVSGAKPASYAFLDQLALRRDEIWHQLRLKRDPNTADLDTPWPKGLPIQALTPDANWSHMPYLQSRARDTVFMESSIALQPAPDEDSNEQLVGTIGRFIDSYPYALKVYVKSGSSGKDRQQRIGHAWNHAVTKLTGTRMQGKEILRFWEAVFHFILYSLDEFRPALRDLAPELQVQVANIPVSEDNYPVEWNPDPGFRSDREKSRLLSPVVLDCMLDLKVISSSDNPYGDNPYRKPSAETKEYSRSNIFDSFEDEDLESLTPAALAYINTKYGCDKSFLLEPFPSKADVMIPAFFLDQDFLEVVSKDMDDFRLVRIASFAPIPLLARLAESVFAMYGLDRPGAQTIVIGLIRHISFSDQPTAALDLIRRVILDHQEVSSWHQYIVRPRFLRTLGPRDALDFFRDLSSEIQARLVAQKNQTRPKKGPNQTPAKGSGEDAVKPHYVKVTTVKLIARILRNATYFDPQFACDVLLGILKTAWHVDIRIAVINSLLSMLGTGSTLEPRIADTILEAIEQHVVPIASALNEIRPETEDDWLEAESGNELPRIVDRPSPRALPPILELLVNAKDYWKEGTSSRHNWVSRILTPIVEKSTANNRRWTKLFVARHKLAIDPATLPALPTIPSLLFRLFTSDLASFNKANFEILKQYSLAHLQMADSLEAAKEKLIDDNPPGTELPNDIQQWKSLWWPSNPFQRGLGQIIERLGAPSPDSPIADHPSLQSLQEFVLDAADIMIKNSRVGDFETLIHLISSISPHHQIPGAGNCISLLEILLRRVDNLRTLEWQCNASRKPERLPGTFKIKTAIFELKRTLNRRTETGGIDHGAAAADITALITDIVEEEPFYHETWPALKPIIMKTIFRNDYTESALTLATSIPVEDIRLTLVDLLKSEVVDDLLHKAGNIHDDDGVKERVSTLLRRWANSPVERIRLRGTATAKLLGYSLTP
ncbi:hypothetical protein F4861DRAFT_538604 [Xylaria intraflava]|nr:hypothetical protein F4861DRAFT_538604 [Xylaria intraflava]